VSVDLDRVAHEAAWDALPYPAVPPHTRRGVAHKVVSVEGTLWAGWHRVGMTVVGATACGRRGLVMDRDSSGFPLCKRCYGTDEERERYG